MIHLSCALGLTALAGCSDNKQAPPPPTAARAAAPASARAKALDPAALGSDRALTLAALAAPHRRVLGALGAYELRARTKLATQIGKASPRRVDQELELRVDRKGQFAARKTIGKQHGQQVVFVDGWLYPRLRYQRWLKRRPLDKDEPRRIAGRFYGLLPAYIKLLSPSVAVARAGQAEVAGRQAIEVRLSKRPEPGDALEAPRGPARSWRETLTVESLEGRVWIDAEHGVPLRATLNARASFTPPDKPDHETGIPRGRAAGKRATITISLEQRVIAVGSVSEIVAPAEDVLADPRRLRLELERQIALGERPLPPEWPDIDPSGRTRAPAKRTK